jgi:Leucine-rich repeat (LRR) protein
MKQSRSGFFVLMLVMLTVCVYAQQPKPAQKKGEPVQSSKPDTKKPASNHEAQVREMISFLEYLLNTLGSASTSTRDKDVVITESYSRIFRDHKVQIEDDLDESRSVITNKDVTAYLKDVDFFFKDVKFEFTIDNIREQSTGSDIIYTVALTRNLKGTTADGNTVNTTMPRFIEVNYNAKDQDLKIVSMYTRPFDEKAALLSWWSELSLEWQNLLKTKLPGGEALDSVTLQHIRSMAGIEALDLSYNPYIQHLEPLAQLVNLRSLNLAHTNIDDLTPIRNLTELKALDLSGTKVSSIEALRYAGKLESFNISRTRITDLGVVGKFSELRQLDISATRVGDLGALENLGRLEQLNLAACPVSSVAPLSKLMALTELNLAKTFVTDLNPLAPLINLAAINLDSTRVTRITALKNLEKLQRVSMNFTPVTDLTPLNGLRQLEKIYCDHTPVKRPEAEAFMTSNPGVLVIFDSKDMQNWWESLDETWQAIISQAAGMGTNPGKEELARITLIDSINFAGNKSIRDLAPLKMLQKLNVIIARETGITDLSPLSNHREIRKLDISHTEVRNIFILKSFTGLKTLIADNSMIQDIEALSDLTELEKIYADNTAINEFLVQQFLEKSPECLVIFKSSILERWWSELSESWREVFLQQVPVRTQHRREDLHKLVELESISFKESGVTDLSALRAFVRLKSLEFSNTAITDLSPLSAIPTLTTLTVSNNPIKTIDPVKNLDQLTHLDISNTAVSDLRPLATLTNLKSLNCAGTQVNRLNALQDLEQLESLDCSNTKVSRLDPVYALPLKTLTCYNTSLSKRAIENFKDVNPYCQVMYYR